MKDVMYALAGLLLAVSCNNDPANDEQPAPADYREAFTGTYTGYRDCAAWNMAQSVTDTSLAIIVTLGNSDSTLMVENEEVYVDSTGSFPYPSMGSYRLFDLQFRNDSMFRYQEWGNVNVHEHCRFEGKKL